MLLDFSVTQHCEDCERYSRSFKKCVVWVCMLKMCKSPGVTSAFGPDCICAKCYPRAEKEQLRHVA